MAKKWYYDTYTKTELMNRDDLLERRIDKLEKFVIESKEFEKIAFISIIIFYCYIGLHVGIFIAERFFL